MAASDINFYKYLEAAFRFKLFSAEGQRTSFDTNFNYLNYNLTFKKIFHYAKRVLPKFYRGFPDTEEGNLQMARDFIQKLDRHQDPELEKYFNPATTPKENELIIQEAIKESVAVPTEQQTAESPPPQTASALHAPRVSLPQMQSIQQTKTATLTKGEATETMESPQEEARQTATSPRVKSTEPIPKAFTKAFENEPEFKTDPTKSRTSISRPKIPQGISNLAKNFGSSASIGFRKGISGIGRGLSAMFGRVGQGSFGILGVIGSRGGRFLGGVGIRSLDSLVSFSNQVSRGSVIKMPPVKFWLILLGAFLLVGALAAISSPDQPTPTAEAGPISTSYGLDYTLPLRNPSVVPQDVRSTILQSWPNAQIDNWQTIIDQAKSHNWNPAVLLTLWIEESGAQGATSYTDPLGCDVGKPTTDIQISLGCFFNSFDNIFTNDQFPQFLLTYSAPNDPYPFKTNPDFPKNFKDWYSRLVPSGPGAIIPLLAETLGCPTVGTITNPYGYNIPDQPDNVKYAGCGNLPQCHSGIDIAYRAGTSVHATFDGIATTVGEDGVKGKYITISNSASGYAATFAHLNSQNITQGESVKRGQVIGTMGSTGIAYGAHLHYRLEKNGKLINPLRFLGPSATIASISLIQSDEISQNDYTGKPASFNWGQCNRVP